MWIWCVSFSLPSLDMRVFLMAICSFDHMQQDEININGETYRETGSIVSAKVTLHFQGHIAFSLQGFSLSV